MFEEKKVVILFGPPGSGKSTVANKLQQITGVDSLIAGQLLREEVTKQSDLGKKIEPYIRKGQLVPTPIVTDKVREDLDKKRGSLVIFDGFPRRMKQLKPFFALLDERDMTLSQVIILNVSHAVSLKRLTGHRLCPQCGAAYHVNSDPPYMGGTCKRCGAKVRNRKDDKLEVVNRRILEYEQQTAPVATYFQSNHSDITKEVNAEKKVEEMMEAVISILKNEWLLLE